MGRSQKWPDLRSPISKIRDMRFVGTGDLIIFRKFHNFPWNIVAVARLESYFVVGSLDLTWWPDLTWHWVEIFTKVAEKMGGKVGENPEALRAGVFSLSSKNLRGGVQTPPPPPSRAGDILAYGSSGWLSGHLRAGEIGNASCGGAVRHRYTAKSFWRCRDLTTGPLTLSKRWWHVSAYNSETVGWAWHFDHENRNKNVPAFNL